MQNNKKLRFTQIAAAIFACAAIAFGVLTVQANTNLSHLHTQYQALEGTLSSPKPGLETRQEPEISPDDVQAYIDKTAALETQNASQTGQIDALTAKNGEQATELNSRQAQIDDLWARVDAAQKNLDAAYAANVPSLHALPSSYGSLCLHFAPSVTVLPAM